ncbi:MAG: family 16 glycosylhydrolase [Oligoflexia bacterium]|nr:family 16 glycosylhydrolase [Oligoflexia bacterium]
MKKYFFFLLTRTSFVVSIIFIISIAIPTCFLAKPINIVEAATNIKWQQIWSDEFNLPFGNKVNEDNWQYDIGSKYPGGPDNWGTGEIEIMTNSTANVYTDGEGHLRIKALRNSDGIWTSGRIETQRSDFAAPANGILAVEASIQLPEVSPSNGGGYWPAFWLLGAGFRGNYNNWPQVGEIDILENINGSDSIFATVHCGIVAGGPCNERIGLSKQYMVANLQTSYHKYRMELDRSISPEQIRFYFDDHVFYTINSSQLDVNTWRQTFHHGFIIILNLAIGGEFPAAFGGVPSEATMSGGSMSIDYVRVYIGMVR